MRISDWSSDVCSSDLAADQFGKGSSLLLVLGARHTEPMNLSDCPVCGRRELRGARSLHTVRTTRGDLFALTCRGCGAALAAGSNRLLRRSAERRVGHECVSTCRSGGGPYH